MHVYTVQAHANNVRLRFEWNQAEKAFAQVDAYNHALEEYLWNLLEETSDFAIQTLGKSST